MLFKFTDKLFFICDPNLKRLLYVMEMSSTQYIEKKFSGEQI